MAIIANVEDFRRVAKRRLPRLMFDFIDGGSYSEETMRRNSSDFGEIVLQQRVMRDVTSTKLSKRLFGQEMSMPLILGPVGLAGMLARRGEAQAAKAAARNGVPFCLSSVSICGIEEVADVSGAPSWFQLYMIRDTGYMEELLARAASFKCPVLILTVDLGAPAQRLRDHRSGLSGDPGVARYTRRAVDAVLHPNWLWDVMVRGGPHSIGNFAPGIPDANRVDNFNVWIRKNSQPRVTWQEFEWVRKRWPGPIVLKGIMNADDAVMAVEAGVDGIAVSNHGGRQLNGASSSISALPRVAEAVGGRVPVLMDGGIRSGGDVVKALSLGADACLIGRAWAYALAARGEAGVSRLLELFRNEMQSVLALSGCTDVATARQALAHNPFS